MEKQHSKAELKEDKSPSNLFTYIKEYFFIILLALFIKATIIEAYQIPSSSMEDTLLIGDFITANKFIYGARIPLLDWQLPAIREPERGDVIIFIYPGDGKTKYIKRCVGLPGDTILVQNKQLYINGTPFTNPPHLKYIDPNTQPRNRGENSRDNFGPYIVPEDSYFMMGDNRDNSADSRYWGPVTRKLILGKALIIHWSWDNSKFNSPEITANDPLSVPRVFLFNARHFFLKVRWDRLFEIIH